MSALAIVLALAWPCAPPANPAPAPPAQPGLDLPAPPAAPPLDEPTALGLLVSGLEEEIAHFSSIERGADERQRVTIRASLNWRIVAAELLAQGEEAGEAGRTSVLLGLTLAAGRGAIDEMLIAIHRVPGAPRAEGVALDDSAQDLVKGFNESALARGSSLRTLEPSALRRALAEAVAPLVEAASRMRTPVSPGHWLLSGAEASERAPGPVHAGDPIDVLDARAAAADLAPASRTAFAESITFLRRGARFDDLAPAVAIAIDRLSDALDLAEAIDRASWLGEESRALWLGRLDRALVAFRDPLARDSAAVSLEELGRAGRLIASLDGLRERRSRIAEIAESIDGALAGEDGDAAAARARLERLELIVDRMVAYRAIEGRDLPRDLAPVGARLREGYERSERGVIDALAPLLADERAVTDPAVASLLAAQAQHLEDLDRLARLPEQSRTLSMIHPRHAGPIATRTRRLGQWLGDPAHRDEARLALDRLGRDLAACQPIPFERELADRDPAALAASGGRSAELLDAVRTARLAWIEAWALGESDPAPGMRLGRLLRLLRGMAESSAIVADGEGTAFLNSWSLWEMPDPFQARAVSDLAGRLELATVAAVSGDDARFEHELDALEREAPFARLVGRVRSLVRPLLAPLEQGAAGTLGQVAAPMPAKAWLGASEALLADLCRWAVEVDDALARGLSDVAAARQARLDALSKELLEIIEKVEAPVTP